MKVFFIWPNCTMSNGNWKNEPIDAFWVSATEEEAREHFYDKLSELHQEEFDKACADVDHMDRWYRGRRDMYWDDPENDDLFRFLVTRDLSRVDLGFAVYPYSSMWGSGRPFKKLEVEINNPNDLGDLNE